MNKIKYTGVVVLEEIASANVSKDIKLKAINAILAMSRGEVNVKVHVDHTGLYAEKTNDCNALVDAFAWDSTPQGWEFWDDIFAATPNRNIT